MSVAGTLINFALGAASIAFPAAGPILGIIQKLEPYGEAAIPLLRAAVSQGPDAFAAAKAAAPDLFNNLSEFIGKLKEAHGDFTPVTDHELAVTSAHIAQVDPPGWTHEDTVRWWERGSEH